MRSCWFPCLVLSGCPYCKSWKANTSRHGLFPSVFQAVFCPRERLEMDEVEEEEEEEETEQRE
ncbi:hypothetical protein E2C01_080654 [Portunus trituberculatus]|uniref:Uncharacterized protein n=1 Tax=Portunus trituberculatus TaxID=210409 RepID=A0A5B7IVZ3_PORTR|nr:hypothetical protein [Portunus trituberculatus]